MFSDFRSLLASGPYPQVFGALGAEGALAVSPPNPGRRHPRWAGPGTAS